jgi:hypothetical protein
MKFGVIYSIEWFPGESTECPALNGESSKVMELFDVTEDTAPDEDEDEEDEEEKEDDDEGRRMKFVSKDLLSREEFEKFLQHTRLTASPTPTMGSIIGYAWGMGWTAPAVAFESDSGDYDELAYVTPVPEVEPRQFHVDSNNPLGLVAHVTEIEEYQDRCWERVRKAVINTYEHGV